MVNEIVDPVLSIIVDLTLHAEQSARPLFPDAVREPYFYSRYVKRWILEGVNERTAIETANEKFKGNLMK